jgi:predicted secreted protein
MIVKYVPKKALLIPTYLLLIIVLISIFANTGNQVIQIISFGQSKAMAMKQYDSLLYKNVEKNNDLISSRTVNSSVENKMHEVENITVNKSKEFTISLESNPTTGYQWIPIFNSSIINLISHNFQPSTTKLIGSSVKEIFKFKAINYGTQSLKMIYKRSWEKEPSKERLFVINIR